MSMAWQLKQDSAGASLARCHMGMCTDEIGRNQSNTLDHVRNTLMTEFLRAVSHNNNLDDRRKIAIFLNFLKDSKGRNVTLTEFNRQAEEVLKVGSISGEYFDYLEKQGAVKLPNGHVCIAGSGHNYTSLIPIAA